MQKIDIRSKTQEVKRLITFADDSWIWLAIEGLNACHAARELEVLGCKITRMQKNRADGYFVPKNMVEDIERLQAGGWEWE